ncbi:predicted protein [Plenodomus lingam JN3]|uniref:Predicted protein n=1 Tax=Leptosphaeria maculans (strain JN3 / isolate v23.1.3 / race Av1-4-5-6-7-8) TaxID=985895 RepID=E4ZH93_LEPMJ|nr:predicted protein [Plenodomus lingam JN3]CBX90663.1 predicted protein [Plenodomus lingam JN3]
MTTDQEPPSVAEPHLASPSRPGSNCTARAYPHLPTPRTPPPPPPPRSLLWASALAFEEAKFYNLRLHEYRWTLSVSSERA